jgi:hypothetical protein
MEVIDAGEGVGRELLGGVVLEADMVMSIWARGRLAAADRVVLLASARVHLR